MSYKIISLDQGTDAWHEFRKDKIGASDAPAIMGVSPWMSIYDKWMEKCGLLEVKEPTFYMQRGIRLESKAREKFIEMSGIEVFPTVIQCNEDPWLIASLDGLSADGKVCVELKCPGEKDHNIALQGKIPEKYYPQLQHILLITNLEGIWYFSYHADIECKSIYVERNYTYICKLEQKEKEFYDCMMQRIPPECRETRTLQMDNELWEAQVHRYIEAKCKKEFWETEMQRAKECMVDLSGGSEAQGMGIKLSKITRKGAIDWQRVCDFHRIAECEYEKFRKPDTEYWTIIGD